MLIRVAAAALAALIFSASGRPVAIAAATRPAVLVVGGTPAGVAAAVSAARHGADVTLVAEQAQLGGVLTGAGMDQWDLNLAPDGTPVEGGIFNEIYATLGDAFTPGDAARVFAGLVADEPRIHTVTGARAIAVRRAAVPGGTQLESVTFARSGAPDITIHAGAVIDATDDAAVAALAGARYDLGRQDTGLDERMQAVTLMFTLGDVDWPAVMRDYRVGVDGPGGTLGRRAWGYAKLMDAYRPPSSDVLVRDLNLGYEGDGSVTVNAIDVLGIDGLSARDVSRARTLTEADVPSLLAYLRGRLPGFETARLAGFADALYVRETRHVLGLDWLTAGDVWNGTMPADRIALGSYPLDLHPVTATDRPAYAPLRHVYGVPFGALIPLGFANLLLAGPAISASHEAAGSARVIPTTIEEGEADGAAAALALTSRLPFPELDRSAADIHALQSELRAGGAILDYVPPVLAATRRHAKVA